MIAHAWLENLPVTFSLDEARDILKWQADSDSLKNALLGEGFLHHVVRVPGTPDTRRVFTRPHVFPHGQTIGTVETPTGEGDRWECGSDQQIAKLALLLIDRNRIADVAAFSWLEGTITAAGPRFCQQMTERLDGSNEVPF